MKLSPVCLIVSCLTALLLVASGVLERSELQTINKMFEARRWLNWSPESLARLNARKLWRYHQSHEIPRTWWAWDYTLSWLIENNHPTVNHKFVIFNHLLEDEPPIDALPDHPWMKPLMQYPPARKTIADAVEYLARSGARLIVLDNDFPQYSADDASLALAIHKASQGDFSNGRPVPVLMASTVNHRAFANALALDVASMPVGVLSELKKLEPGVDVAAKYTGITSVVMDEDQVIRRLACTIPAPDGAARESLALKAVRLLGEPVPKRLPQIMDIDFSGPPESELYPVRPFSYLLDPDKRAQMQQKDSTDVTLNDAVVLLGDGVIDVYPTPYTNLGVNLMSGTELLAQSMETVARQSWPMRLSAGACAIYLVLCCLAGWLGLELRRWFTQRQERRTHPFIKLTADLVFVIAISSGIYCLGFALFAYSSLIVPVVAPAVAFFVGALATVLYEREQEHIKALAVRLESAQVALQAERQRFAADLALQAAEAKAQEVAADQKRRKEFVRRINHDLKAPVTVLNWTLARLKQEGLQSSKASDRVDHIGRTSDRLFDLIAELVRTYENDAIGVVPSTRQNQVCDLCTILSDCVQMQQGLAEINKSNLTLDIPDYGMPLSAPSLELSRVFDNLIRNALIHNPRGTYVEVTARTRANVHQVTVTDNGRGIASASLQRIFDANFSTGTKDSGSQGLGLAIVKAAVEKLGGSIIVDSEEDMGTTFTVSLPVASDTSFDGIQLHAPASASNPVQC